MNVISSANGLPLVYEQVQATLAELGVKQVR